jgi:hypothetical protein
MGNSTTSEAYGKHVWLETLFLLWMMPRKNYNITMGFTLLSDFVYIFTSWDLHKVAFNIVHYDWKISFQVKFFVHLGLCGTPIMSRFVFGMCWKHGVYCL